MAEEKKTPAKVEESKLTKVLVWFKKLPGRIAKPFKNMVAELKKVTWPSKKKLISSSILVLVFMLFMGVVIGLLDLGATAAVKGLVTISAPKATATVEPEATAEPTAEVTAEPTAEVTAEPTAEVTADSEATTAPVAE